MYLKARYYDPMRGGFLSRDPAHYAGGQNLYAYVRGNPVNAFDPSGLSPGIGIGIGIGGGWGPISGSVSCKWQQCNQDNGCVTEGFQCSACGGGKLKGDIPNWKPSIPSPNVGVTIGNDCKFKSGWDDEEKSKGGPIKVGPGGGDVTITYPPGLGACPSNTKRTEKRGNSDDSDVGKSARSRFSVILARQPVLRFEISEYSDRLLDTSVSECYYWTPGGQRTYNPYGW